MGCVCFSTKTRTNLREEHINKFGREVVSILEPNASGTGSPTQECLSSSHESRIRLPLFTVKRSSVKGAVGRNAPWIMTWTGSQEETTVRPATPERMTRCCTQYASVLFLLITPILMSEKWKSLSSLVRFLLFLAHSFARVHACKHINASVHVAARGPPVLSLHYGSRD